MKIIFCQDPLNPHHVDEAYQAELEAVTAFGVQYSTINFDVLVDENNLADAVRRVPVESTQQIGIYRGWMLKPDQYRGLYSALLDKGIRLINNPNEYRYCHYLPESYSVIEKFTPRSVWLPIAGSASVDEIMELLTPFESKPVIIKDFVKSQKHYWNEAFLIPSASNREVVERIVNRFLELQGDDLSEGLVFREFVEFERLGTHSKSGMPLTKEFRVFVLNGEPLDVVEYWEEGDYKETRPEPEQFRTVMQNVHSNFFTLDLAKRKDDNWMIVELGDAQVAGLPEKVDTLEFYRKLTKRLQASDANYPQ